jgi:hypothetical protein
MTSKPALTCTEKQAFQLIACFEQGHLGSRIHWLGSWLTLVPRRIGLSPALDSAVGLIASVHAAMLHERCPSTWIDPEAYLRAIIKLRESLADPVDGYSAETLTAATILYYLEVRHESPFRA